MGERGGECKELAIGTRALLERAGRTLQPVSAVGDVGSFLEQAIHALDFH